MYKEDTDRFEENIEEIRKNNNDKSKSKSNSKINDNELNKEDDKFSFFDKNVLEDSSCDEKNDSENEGIVNCKDDKTIALSFKTKEQQNWLYYTRSPLMDTYRDNLYRENYSLTILMSLRGDRDSRTAGISLKFISVETKKEYRVGDLENFLFSVVVGARQFIDGENHRIELEYFSKNDAKLIRFLNAIYQEREQKEENGKLWLKDYKLFECLELLKNIAIRLEGRAVVFSDELLKVAIEIYYNQNYDLSLSVRFKDESIDISKVNIFGSSCPYILYKDVFYFTEPSYPKIKKVLFKDDVIIDKKYIKDFCARVLPNIKKDFEISVPKELEESEDKAYPAHALVFLDYDGECVYAAIKFKYGRFTVDPYGGKVTSSDMLDSDLSVYRDEEKENYFCDTLSKYLEKEAEYTYSTKDDEKIFYLCYKALPTLQDKGWTFFYSEAFRSLKINVKPPRLQVSLTKDINFFEINFSFEGVEEIHDLSNIIKQIKTENKEYIRLQNGSFIPVDLEIMDYLAKMLTETSATQKDDTRYLIPMFSAPYFAEALEKHSGVALNLEESAKNTLKEIKSVDYDEEPPKNLGGTFREYQLIGYKWIRKLSDMSLSGILADDMGLGKSFQTIASILKEKELGSPYPNLIIAPTSCVANWYMEIKKFAPTLETIMITGSAAKRAKRIKVIENFDVAIISYSTLRRDIKTLSDRDFNYVIIDEAQHIKNANTQNAKTVKSLKCQKRLALTGTPIENSISEMWSMFDFLMPGFFGKHKDFVERYEAPILSSKEEESDIALENLKNRIAPFILRRLKIDVLKDLPKKHTNIAYCELTKDQKELYMSILEAARLEIFETVKRKGFKQSHIEIFSALTRLRQVCCHPKLLISDLRGESNTSGKFNLFMEMIREAISGGHNVLVFSQFTKMLNIMREAFKKHSIEHLYLDGHTKDRMDLVNRFNSGESPIFLLSLKAAGTGLTLTKADTVIHYDLWWNPAVEDQATDRAYRIGQTRAVTNYKMVTRGTIEEKILALQEKKRVLIDSVVSDTSGKISKLSWDEVKNLIR